MKDVHAIVTESYIYKEETHFTILKSSLFSAGDGFTAYDSNAQPVFRVDCYGPENNDEVVMMDASGRCLLTVCRKRLSLHNRWEGFVGDGDGGQKPIFSVRRASIFGRCSMKVETYNSKGDEYYLIEGSFSQKSCTILNAGKKIVAEIERKVDASTNMMLGKDVYSLSIKPGFDGAFAMALVLVLDQIQIDDGYDSGDDDVIDISNLYPSV